MIVGWWGGILLDGNLHQLKLLLDSLIIIPYFTVEVPICFDSYNQPRLGGGQLFEHAAIELWKCPPKSISTLLPCTAVCGKLATLTTNSKLAICVCMLSYVLFKNNKPTVVSQI